MSLPWTALLLSQLTWHWENQLRPRLEGLTDAEFLWRPVEDSWSIARAGESDAPMAVGSGEWLIDSAFPQPEPAPVTTIAWRVGHLLVGVLGARNASHFGAAPASYEDDDDPGTADEALRRLDEAYATWCDGVRGLDGAALAAPCGEGGFEQDPMAALVLHIHREVIHHGAEIALLRDLYLREG
ncbi:serine/arginine repetitive matrix protein 1 [Serinibacter arcticus]|uniref:Serine/arginine repetitive matrix protein 1 n=1 Tax=Serinibacter arcticus TaxID=1655435 RepID=A0A2U1ZTM2_9MICO|nr:DinB family protein [Serinibacter arcticus]PWD50311.1 serine/arginine repetitive matrix protein 1 [Serinibacter arcticus]